jgi:hypothetical protein
MKHLLPALFLLITAAPLLANDDGGDGAYIPSYPELVREGYAPREHTYQYQNEGYYVALNTGFHMAPKPTQAYYGRGYVIYYGYQMTPVFSGHEDTIYAFGHPLTYFRQLLPPNVDESNISDVAVEVRHTSYYQPGDYVAQRHYRSNEITTVEAVKPAARPAFKTTINPTITPSSNTLPAIGEKPSH